MKLLPRFRIGNLVFEPEDEQPGVLVVLLLILGVLFASVPLRNGVEYPTDPNAQVEHHEE